MRISDWSSDVCSSDLIGLLKLQSLCFEEYQNDDWSTFLYDAEERIGDGVHVVNVDARPTNFEKIVLHANIADVKRWVKEMVRDYTDVRKAWEVKIGRESCRERVGKYEWISGVA